VFVRTYGARPKWDLALASVVFLYSVMPGLMVEWNVVLFGFHDARRAVLIEVTPKWLYNHITTIGA